jgi:small-conductance mechanosensitive channel
MATDIASLFGLTPEGLSQQRYQQDLRRGVELAQLDPGAAARATLQSGVGQLGRGIAGMMGVEDPQMKLISARQSIIGQLDQTDPTSLLRGAKSLSDMGDQQGAFALADYARKAQSEIAQAQQRMAAANRERQQATPNDIQIANELSTLQDTLDQLKAQPASPERDRAMNLLTTRYTELQRLTTKPEKDLRFGTDRESISAELYDKPFATLTPTERGIVNKRVEDEQGRKAEKGAAKLTNVMPGQKDFADIPKFRADVQKTIAPQIESVNAADQALQAINDSITKNNFVSFNAARVQLAKALGDSQLSRRDVEQAGGDPSLFGKLLDSTSTLFTGTPTLETQNLIKNTLQAVKKVSTNKATREIDAQRQIAYSTPGYDKARVDLALKFPEFEATKQVDVSGDLAAQARALLKQRQEGKK